MLWITIPILGESCSVKPSGFSFSERGKRMTLRAVPADLALVGTCVAEQDNQFGLSLLL